MFCLTDILRHSFSLNYTTLGDVHRPVFETKKTRKGFQIRVRTVEERFYLTDTLK
jgi:hypothetical protein